jgi:hypothetical protein
MDINDLRSLVTVLGFLLFLALVARVWRSRALPSHQKAALLVFEGEAEPSRESARVPSA